MTTLLKSAFIATLCLFSLYSQAQFSTSSGVKKQKDEQTGGDHNRQQDIALMERNGKHIEQDVYNRNSSDFDKHQTEMLEIMDREIARSRFDLANLKQDLKTVPGGYDGQEGRALRIEIQQMEGRLGKQEYIRQYVAGLTVEKLNDTRQLAGLRGQYYHFISTMKTNLKYEVAETGGQSGQGGGSGTGTTGTGSTSTGTSTNILMTSSKSKSSGNKQELPESYYMQKDKKEAASYLTTKKSTASALNNAVSEIKSALGSQNNSEAGRVLEGVMERLSTDIDADKLMVSRLEKGELKFSGLDAEMIGSQISKKEGVLEKVKAISLPQDLKRFTSLIGRYIKLLE